MKLWSISGRVVVISGMLSSGLFDTLGRLRGGSWGRRAKYARGPTIAVFNRL